MLFRLRFKPHLVVASTNHTFHEYKTQGAKTRKNRKTLLLLVNKTTLRL